jgi:Single-strand binding protein family
MAADNHTTIVGNLVEDPEVRFTSSGIAVANLRVAVTRRVQQDGQWRDGDTSFFKVNVWRGQAEHLGTPRGRTDTARGRWPAREGSSPPAPPRAWRCRPPPYCCLLAAVGASERTRGALLSSDHMGGE